MTRKSVTPETKKKVQVLESLARAGVTHLPKPRRGAVAAKQTVDVVVAPKSEKPSAPVVKESAPVVKVLPNTMPVIADTGTDSLEKMCQEVASCVRCPQLASTRNKTVFGVGNPHARLCFFGEAPGADEDEQGIPFVGRAGQLLTKIIEACGMKREDVYILNVLKCRPPNNRPPLPEEVANCREYFQRQFRLIRPEFICCLGTSAAQALLQTDTTIGKLRKQFFQYETSQVICTYHPSYLLRNPPAKKDVWDDMKMLLAKMGLPVPQ